MIRKYSAKPGQGMNLDPIRQQTSFTFQGPPTAAPSVFALEGLFKTLCQRLNQLTQLRTDLPDDYVGRIKATFTDQLLNELEGQGYHSPAFDRLIALRDAYDN